MFTFMKDANNIYGRHCISKYEGLAKGMKQILISEIHSLA